jgi:hypothetical protein
MRIGLVSMGQFLGDKCAEPAHPLSIVDFSGITGQFAFMPTIANRLIWCGREACCIILQPVSSYFSLSKRVHICLPSDVPLTNAGVRAG